MRTLTSSRKPPKSRFRAVQNPHEVRLAHLRIAFLASDITARERAAVEGVARRMQADGEGERIFIVHPEAEAEAEPEGMIRLVRTGRCSFAASRMSEEEYEAEMEEGLAEFKQWVREVTNAGSR